MIRSFPPPMLFLITSPTPPLRPTSTATLTLTPTLSLPLHPEPPCR